MFCRVCFSTRAWDATKTCAKAHPTTTTRERPLTMPFAPRRTLRRLLNRARPAALVLLYHRVTTLDTDPQWLTVSPELFGDQLNAIKRHYTLLSLTGLVKQLD